MCDDAMITPLLIGDVEIAGRILIAPMTGVTDLPFRRENNGNALNIDFDILRHLPTPLLAGFSPVSMLRIRAREGGAKPLGPRDFAC